MGHAAAGELEQEVQPPDQEKEEKDGAPGVEVRRHVARQHHVGVRGAGGEEEAEQDADQESPPGQVSRPQPEGGAVAPGQVLPVLGGQAAAGSGRLAHAEAALEQRPQGQVRSRTQAIPPEAGPGGSHAPAIRAEGGPTPGSPPFSP